MMLIFVCWLNAWNGNRKYVRIAACVLELGGVIGVRYSIIILQSHPPMCYTYCPKTLQWRSVDMLNYIVLALDKQYVRLYCYGCAWTWRCYWCSINELWGRILTLLIRCLNTLPLQWRWQLTLRWPSFVEWCMELVLRWSLTNRLYVYILL